MGDVKAGAPGDPATVPAPAASGRDEADAMARDSIATGLVERVSSRNALAALGAVAFTAVAVFVWASPAPLMLRVAAVVPSLLGAGLAWRWLIPAQARLIVDARGIGWSIGRQAGIHLRWGEIRGIRRNEDDHGFRLLTGHGAERHIPTVFLRSEPMRAAFLGQAAQARPDLAGGLGTNMRLGIR